jgi:hypothetical protein
MARHSNSHFSNRTRKRCEARAAATLERFYGKRDLARTWATIDKAYARELWTEAEALRKTLDTKGVHYEPV